MVSLSQNKNSSGGFGQQWGGWRTAPQWLGIDNIFYENNETTLPEPENNGLDLLFFSTVHCDAPLQRLIFDVCVHSSFLGKGLGLRRKCSAFD